MLKLCKWSNICYFPVIYCWLEFWFILHLSGLNIRNTLSWLEFFCATCGHWNSGKWELKKINYVNNCFKLSTEFLRKNLFIYTQICEYLLCTSLFLGFLLLLLLGVFTKLRKATVTFIMSVCLSIWLEHLGSHWMAFHESSYLSIFRKSVEKIQVSLKSDKNNGHFMWRPMYIYNISLNSTQNEKYFRKKL
jgi:hypothetical protein